MNVSNWECAKKWNICIRPRQWKRNSGGDSFRPSNGANRRPRSFYSRRWIPDARVARAGLAAGTGGGKAYRTAVAAARNVEAATCGAALPWPPLGIASAPTVEAVPPAAAAFAVAVVAGSAAPSVANQSRLMIASSLMSNYHVASVSLCFPSGN